MSKAHPECPLYNHNACKSIHLPKLCAIVREDKKCLKPPQNKKEKRFEKEKEKKT